MEGHCEDYIGNQSIEMLSIKCEHDSKENKQEPKRTTTLDDIATGSEAIDSSARQTCVSLSKLKLCLIISGMVLLSAATSTIIAAILKQDFEGRISEIKVELIYLKQEGVYQETTWSPWTNWGFCSASCNGGIMTRTRRCNWAEQSGSKGSCSGNDVDINACNNNTCVVPMVYFTMHKPIEDLEFGKVIFSRTVANVGGAYNTQTGDFVCPVAGLYHFYFSFMQMSTSFVYCGILHNGVQLTQAETSSGGTEEAASTSVYVELSVGDTIYVSYCKNWEHVNHEGNEGVFTGSLIHI